ncbi:glycosyltransferase family 2 protein [Carnobacterium gallinarum]|uniref:glycosyltransferase family 2 protein n=1 Tax=Carnobacterium gallinarum TaxID=2749 RepID=UPI0005552959|nr:glycosyltransferase family 2 protein [Carnobacterium gallinarum]
MKTVAILLSAYNGTDYITKQIESIQGQNYQNWQLFVRDDGSSDTTKEIVRNMGQSDNRIQLYEDELGNLRVIKSFLELLKNVEADYYMFCDQDDFWKADKVERTLVRMEQLEAKKQNPYLVHTDLVVVDNDLEVISESMFGLQKMSFEKTSLNHLLVQNNITGCTTMINNDLKDLVVYHQDIVMHDWWLGLIASSFGEISFLQETTILYRQHGNNTVGAKKYGLSYFYSRYLEKAKTKQIQRNSFKQAQAFYEIYGARLSDKDNEVVKNYGEFLEGSILKRGNVFFKYKYFKNTTLRNTIFLPMLLFLKAK